MKKCAVCGAECAPDALSCPMCGEASFVEGVPAAEQEPVRKASKPAKGDK